MMVIKGVIDCGPSIVERREPYCLYQPTYIAGGKSIIGMREMYRLFYVVRVMANRVIVAVEITHETFDLTVGNSQFTVQS